MNVDLSASINYISLCAGAGGLDLAVRIVFPDARCLCYVEREIYPAAILASHMESGALDAAPIWSDLTTFSGAMFRGRVDLVISGIPCQPYSAAGKQLGHEDERALWPHLCRVVGEIRPAVVFIENVPPFLNEFRPVGNRLQEMGYRVEEPLFLTAAECGAPHRRERVFILAHRDRTGRSRIAQSDGDSIRVGVEASRWGDADRFDSNMAHTSRGGLGELREPSGRNGQPDGSNESLADATSSRCDDAGEHGSGSSLSGARPIEPVRELGNAERTGSQGTRPKFEEWRRELVASSTDRRDVPLSIFPPGPAAREQWASILSEHPEVAPAIEPNLCRVVDGLAAPLDRHRQQRLRAAGNGVVGIQAALALIALVRRIKSPKSAEDS